MRFSSAAARGRTKTASDPQDADSPLRRQAMWFGGEDNPSFLETPLVSEDDIKRAVREVYRGFLQPGAILHNVAKHLFDFGFYYRGLRYLIGHLTDFRS